MRRYLDPVPLIVGSALSPHQTVQLGHGALGPRLADVPHLHAALPSGVDMACGGADGDGAHHLSVVQAVNLTGVTRDSWTQQSVGGEGHGLHLPIRTHVEGISPAEKIRTTGPKFQL